MICVDASLAAKWILEEERSNRAKALYRATVRAARPIVAPPLLPLEVTNILRQRTRLADGLSPEGAAVLLDEFLALPIEIRNPEGLHRRALTLAWVFDLPAAYDAHYLALAEHLGCEFWTDDERLVRRVENDVSFVRRLSEGPLPAEG